ncbi:MAG: ABC transporter substrate-binding protein [Spirochaetaceae bacterium]
MKRAVTVGLLLILPFSAAVAAGADEEGGRSRLLEVGLSGSPDTLDPQGTTGTLTFQTMRSVYDTLVEPNEEGEIVPALARSYEVSEDGRVWRFDLREGVTFHHGRGFDAEDVVATLNRVTDDSFGSPNAQEFELIENVVAEDDYTLRIELTEPHAPLLATLASGWSAILPADLIEAGHDFGAQPVGTGPFSFVEWNRDSALVLERNDSYWKEGEPWLEGVRFNIITERAVQAQSLMGGELHVADLIVEPELSMIRQHPQTRVDEAPSSLVMVLAMNTDRSPLSDPRLREGIAHAVDRQAVMDFAYSGGETVGTFMNPTNRFYVDYTDMYPYDLAEARERIAAAGETRELVLTLPQNYEPHVKAGELYQEMLEAAGLEVSIQLVDWSSWLSEVFRGGQYDLTVIGHTGKLDPHGRLAPFAGEDNYVGWEDPEATRLINEARRTFDEDRRRELYGEVLEIMAREVPFVFVGSPYRYVGLRREVGGFVMDPQLDTYDFRRTRLEGGR